MILRFTFFSVILLYLCAAHGLVEKQSNKSTIIDHINIHGNRTTKEYIIKAYLAIDSGSIVDSTSLHYAKQRLLRTQLFTKVALFTLEKDDGIHLYVIVTERFYITPDAGGGYYSYKYGEEDLWFRFNLSIHHKNFFGRAENVKVSIGFWDWRNISLSWSKPFPPSGYSFTVGAKCDFHPNQSKKINHILYSGTVIARKEISNNVTLGIGFLPHHETQKSIIDDTELKASELYSVIGCWTDFRNRAFNTSKGWYLYTDIFSNHLYHSSSPDYLQSNILFKLFHRGIFPDNIIAWRLATLLRNKDAGPIHYLGLGGTKSIRGYLQPIIGGNINGNNSLLLSMEYRFPVLKLPTFSISMLANVSNLFNSIDLRIHGALFTDYGRVAETATDLFSIRATNIRSAVGLGAGIRLVLPDLETSGCIDIAFAEDYRAPHGTIRFFSTPVFHLYLNFPY